MEEIDEIIKNLYSKLEKRNNVIQFQKIAFKRILKGINNKRNNNDKQNLKEKLD